MASAGEYNQLFGTPQHAGVAGTEQTGLHVVARIRQDSDVDKRLNTSGFLQVHEPPPLVSGDYVVVPTTQGFTEPEDFFEKSTTKYGVRVFRWSPTVTAPDATLVPVWETITDAQLVDQVFCSFGCQTNGYEALFGPAIANGSLYTPGLSGRINRYDLTSGSLLAVIDPLAGTPFSGDPVTSVNSALTATSSAGDILYTVTAWAVGTTNRGVTPRGSWLVRVRPDNSVTAVEWHHIATAALGIPQFPGGLCDYPFGTGGTPGPTGPESDPPRFNCGLQRPAINVPVSIDPGTGRYVVASYANNQWAGAFIVWVDAQTLQSVAAADMRGHALHGCGVRLSGGFNECPSSATCDVVTGNGSTHLGFDPCTNRPVPVFGPDLDSTSVTIAPNGDASWGSYDGGFVYGGEYDARGFGITFRRDGAFRANSSAFYWDATAGVRGDATAPEGFTYVHERQLYSEFATDPLGIGVYDADWRLLRSGVTPRDPNTDPNVTPVDFVAAQPLFDSSGAMYAPNADGHMYKFSGSGQLMEVVDLLDDDGEINSIAALEGYGARDRSGRLYWSFGGFVYVVEGGGPQLARAQLVASPAQTARLRSGKQAAIAGVHNTKLPEPPELMQ